MILHPTLSDEEAFEKIRFSIENSNPFAFIRFGDGELNILKESGSEAFNKKFCVSYGYEYPADVFKAYSEWKPIISRSILEADMIGIMNKDCKTVDHYSEDIWSIDSKDLGRNAEDFKICNHSFSRSKLLGTPAGIKRLTRGRGIHIITPNVEKMKEKCLEKILNIEVRYTEHPLEFNFEDRKRTIDKFKEINEEIVLFGTGINKDFGLILRDEYGKIAIDMGATLDAWSGIMSRGWFKKGNELDYLVI